MPTVTGFLRDIGLNALNGFQPRLTFTPSEPAVTPGGSVFASKAVTVTPDSSGFFTVDLASTDGVRPTTAHWQVSFSFLSPDGFTSGAGFSPHDFPTWKIHVPASGGRLSDMIGGSNTANGLVYIGIDEPPESEGWDWWVDVSTNPPQLKKAS